MVLLTTAAQLAETVLIRSVVYTAELGVRVLYWAGSSTLRYIWPGAPPEPTEVERMQESIRRLEAQVVALEERNNGECIHNDAVHQETQESVQGEECEQAQSLPQGQRMQGC